MASAGKPHLLQDLRIVPIQPLRVFARLDLWFDDAHELLEIPRFAQRGGVVQDHILRFWREFVGAFRQLHHAGSIGPLPGDIARQDEGHPRAAGFAELHKFLFLRGIMLVLRQAKTDAQRRGRIRIERQQPLQRLPLALGIARRVADLREVKKGFRVLRMRLRCRP